MFLGRKRIINKLTGHLVTRALLLSSVTTPLQAELTEDVEELRDYGPQRSKPLTELPLESPKPPPVQEIKSKNNKIQGEPKQPQKSGKARPSHAGMVKFWSNSLSGFRDQGSLSLEEDVVVTQDDIRIEADKAMIFFERTTNEVKEVHAVGSVRFQRVDPESGQPIRAEGKEAIFDNAKRMVTMKGEPVLYRGEDVVRGKVIYYNLVTGWVKADRVEGVMQPSVKKTGSK
jgi:lipopolysaccharide transport protein LptA